MIIRNVKNVEILSKTLVDGTKEHFETIFLSPDFSYFRKKGITRNRRQKCIYRQKTASIFFLLTY